MKTIREEVELTVRGGPATAGLCDVLLLLARDSIQVLASSSYRERTGPVHLLVTTAPAKAQALLSEDGYTCKVTDVIVVAMPEYRPGELAQLWCELAADKIGIICSYISMLRDRGYCAVFKTTDNHQAARILATAAN